ncbi:unnamed protein product, partial [Musa acuminata var. zebrina]
MSLMSKGKFKYVNGVAKAPTLEDASYKTWEIKNMMIFQIKRQIQKMKQGTSSVTDYYNNLRGQLAELDIYQILEMESAADTKRLRNLLEMERV